MLREKDIPGQSVLYYDQDVVAPTVPLDELEEGPASGTWKLVFENDENSDDDLDLYLSRWDVRLFVDGAPDCVP